MSRCCVSVLCLVWNINFVLVNFSILYLGNLWRHLSSSWPCGKEEDVWPRDRNLGQESEEWWGSPQQKLSSAPAGSEVKSVRVWQCPDNLSILCPRIFQLSWLWSQTTRKEGEKSQVTLYYSYSALLCMNDWAKHFIKNKIT